MEEYEKSNRRYRKFNAGLNKKDMRIEITDPYLKRRLNINQISKNYAMYGQYAIMRLAKFAGVPNEKIQEIPEQAVIDYLNSCTAISMNNSDLGFFKQYFRENEVITIEKRGHEMRETKARYLRGELPEDKAVEQVFPLLLIRARGKGARTITGNENYVRALYRLRWHIEIQFRELRRIGIDN